MQIFNSKLGKKTLLQTKVKDSVGLYVCGMTVYGPCHIGHARVLVVFDVVVKVLKHLGYQVHYVRNITDIDDKIIAKSIEEGVSWQDIANKYIDAMHSDERMLGIDPPDQEPKATQHIEQMIAMINILIEKGFAYVAADKDVYFNVKACQNYGVVSKQDIKALDKNVRKTLSHHKHNNLDFVLWKMSKPDEPSWPSPWGNGRPGWHIECSAMATEYLGDNIDLHGGGIDLKFPHHENENAQATCATGHEFVNCWMHVGHVMVDAEKMSKSLNNFRTIKDLAEEFHPEVIRYFLLSSHYRSPINYSKINIEQAKMALLKLYAVIDGVDTASTCSEKFMDNLTDDFNFPAALASCFDLVQKIKETKCINLAAQLKSNLNLLGLGHQTGSQISEYNQSLKISTQEIEKLIAKRAQAKADKNWQLADKIRDDLLQKGIVLEDISGGTSWRVL